MTLKKGKGFDARAEHIRPKQIQYTPERHASLTHKVVTRLWFWSIDNLGGCVGVPSRKFISCDLFENVIIWLLYFVLFLL